MAAPHGNGQVTQGIVVGKPVGFGPAQHQPPSLWRNAYEQQAPPQQPGMGPTSASTYYDQGPAVVEMSCKDSDLPPSIRTGFILKVYAILFLMLLVTFAIALPFVFWTTETRKWMNAHPWIIFFVSAILLVQYVFNTCMMCEMCCGGSSMLRCYLGMMVTVPWNYIHHFVFSCCLGVVVGYICSVYTVPSVIFVFGITALMIAALTAFAVYTNADFTGYGVYAIIGMIGILTLIALTAFFGGTFWHHVLAAGFAILIGFTIVMDTQAIFGSASSGCGGGERTFEYSIDMYAFAAWNLYLNFINFFLLMLQLLGTRRD